MGEKMRICEIAGPFTDDADHAERIKSNCKANFGFETMILAKHILEKGSAYVLDLFEQSREEYLSKVKTVSSKWQRRSKLTGGLILLTAKLVSEAVGYTFQTDRICDILLEADAWLEDKGDIGMQALKMVEEWVENNLQHFIISKKAARIPAKKFLQKGLLYWESTIVPIRQGSKTLRSILPGWKRS